jgi:hypothetical protein
LAARRIRSEDSVTARRLAILLATLAATVVTAGAGAGPAAAVSATPSADVVRVAAVAYAPCPAGKGGPRTAKKAGKKVAKSTRASRATCRSAS